MKSLVGCSGWSFDDWVGRFYPVDLGKRKGEWFGYYAQYFPTVEINSTFYRPPNELLVRNWVAKAKGVEGFEYSVKMPQLVTHESLVKGETKKACEQSVSFEKICVEPLASAGRLGCVLLQLSPYFKNDGASLESLRSVLDALETETHDYAVEFRHRTWLDEGKREVSSAALDTLKEFNVASVLIDGPGFPITKVESADHAYVRFHGRNYDIWYRDETKEDSRLNRYDYLYTEYQLRQWVPRIKEAEERTKKVRVFFNNHGFAKSARNAMQMMDLLGVEHRQKDFKITSQNKLPA
jgi:uncharacterized protein YecE (DUF72 family)